MVVFDQTARRAARRDGTGFFSWAVPTLDPALRLAGWSDARTAGESRKTELTTDAVGEFVRADKPEEPWLLVVEFKAEPERDDLEQLGEYVTHCRRDRRPRADPRLKYLAGGVLLDLTGRRVGVTLSMPVPGVTGVGMWFTPSYLAAADEDAAATLAAIAGGRLARSVLPWVPLMRGADQPAVVEEWKRLANEEPSKEVRRAYALDARIFAGLAGNQGTWQSLVEDHEMRESEFVMEMRADARREDLFIVL